MKELVKEKVISTYHLTYSAPYQTLSFNTKEIKPKINGVKDFVKYFRKSLEYSVKDQEGRDWPDNAIIEIEEVIRKAPDSILQKAVFGMAEAIGKVYGDEGEWIIKDKSLKIPKGSHLYILVSRNQYKKYMKMKKEEPDQFKIMTVMSAGTTDMIKKYDDITNAVEKYLKGKLIVKFIDSGQWDKIRSAHFAKQ
jgi:hypothetical protein